MKKFILLAFALICFGIIKANMVKKAHPCFTPKTFSVTGINRLGNYELAFKFFPEKKIIIGPAPKAISFQNKLMIENFRFDVSLKCLRLRSGTELHWGGG